MDRSWLALIPTAPGRNWCPGVTYHRLAALAERGIGDVSRLPVTLKILLENSVRNAAAPVGPRGRRRGDRELGRHRRRRRPRARVHAGARAPPGLHRRPRGRRPRRDALGGRPRRAATRCASIRSSPSTWSIDHSVQVDAFGNREAYERNIAREYERNRERYSLLRWAQQAFQGFRVVPPGMGIVHQINLEYLAQVVQVREIDGVRMALPDTLVGTDSHTPMVNGIGVLGWGVGGIEAEACMLGQPLFLLAPVVVGVRFHNALPAGTTATDLVLTLTEMLRKHGVVNKFVEFCGTGLTLDVGARPRDALQHVAGVRRHGVALPGRRANARVPARRRVATPSTSTWSSATRRNRACSAPTTRRSRRSARWSSSTSRAWCRASPVRSGRRTASRCPNVWESFTDVWEQRADARLERGRPPKARCRGSRRRAASIRTAVAEEPVPNGPPDADLVRDGSIVIAAITSCTNTSNPAVMVAAGLLARNAVARGLMPPDYVKTSLAPGSRVVTDYLERAGSARLARAAALQPRRLRLHDVHRQQRTAARSWSPSASTPRISPSRRCSAATATSRAASIRRCGRIPRVAAARGRVRARGTPRHRPHHRLARRPVTTGIRCSSATSGRAPTR